MSDVFAVPIVDNKDHANRLTTICRTYDFTGVLGLHKVV